MKTSSLIRRMKKLNALMLLLFAGLLFISCEELTDCIASATPSLESKQLVNGSIGSPYNESITAEVKNDPNDNQYDYYFNVDGTFPTGLTYSVNQRTFLIQGTPTQTGTFTFKLILRVDPPETYDDDGGFFSDDDRICFGDDTTEKSYTLKIN